MDTPPKKRRGRKIKRKFPRTETVKYRTSKEHKHLLKDIRAELPGKNVSDADVIEAALAHYGLLYALEPGNKAAKKVRSAPESPKMGGGNPENSSRQLPLAI